MLNEKSSNLFISLDLYLLENENIRKDPNYKTSKKTKYLDENYYLEKSIYLISYDENISQNNDKIVKFNDFLYKKIIKIHDFPKNNFLINDKCKNLVKSDYSYKIVIDDLKFLDLYKDKNYIYKIRIFSNLREIENNIIKNNNYKNKKEKKLFYINLFIYTYSLFSFLFLFKNLLFEYFKDLKSQINILSTIISNVNTN